MTREQQITAAALEAYFDGLAKAFTDGAVWADENPAWHPFSEQKPDVKGKRNRCFLVALEYSTADGESI